MRRHNETNYLYIRWYESNGLNDVTPILITTNGWMCTHPLVSRCRVAAVEGGTRRIVENRSIWSGGKAGAGAKRGRQRRRSELDRGDDETMTQGEVAESARFFTRATRSPWTSHYPSSRINYSRPLGSSEILIIKIIENNLVKMTIFFEVIIYNNVCRYFTQLKMKKKRPRQRTATILYN